MSEGPVHRHGDPCWIDLVTDDPRQARIFYDGLLGWEADPGPKGSPYQILSLDGRAVAGLMPLSDPMREAGVPPTWTPYVYVESAAEAARAAVAAGGRAPADPFSPAPGLTIAVLIDPGGAVIGALEGPPDGGLRAIGETGTLGAIELAAGDPEEAAAFYAAVFGWSAGVAPEPGAARPLRGPSGVAAWLRPSGRGWRWTVQFSVADCDETAFEAQELGAALEREARDVPARGRIAVLRDPQGALFSLIADSPAG